MEREEQERFRVIVIARIQELEEGVKGASEDVRTVAPDRGIGRLSRLDSMQMQQMALNARGRKLEEIRRLKEALTRIDRGVYGICQLCRRDVAPARLEYQPDAQLCVGCSGGGR